jgi:hypothetical protein
MPDQADSLKISQFLAVMTPVITATIKKLLRSHGLNVKEQGWGLKTAFVIKSGEKQAEFHLHNLLLEIATIDRDERPLRFDEKLTDIDYFIAKTIRITDDKLKILIAVLSEENPNVAIEKMRKETNRYERINFWTVDPKEIN